MGSKKQTGANYAAPFVSWLGKVPSDWCLRKVKYLFKEISDKGHSTEQLLSATQKSGLVPRSELQTRVVMPVGELHSFKLVDIDDFVISLRSFQGGIEYSEHRGLVSPAYTVMRKTSHTHSGYLKHLFKSKPFIGELESCTTGIRQGKNIGFDDLSNSILPVPPFETQVTIARFLDEKTAEIDAAIAKKQRLIQLLNEQKAILINNAVTRGLNPDAPMKDSGVEWIGEIPVHWEVKRVKHVTTRIVDGTHFTPTYVDDGIPFLRVTDLTKSGHGEIDWQNVRRIPQVEHEALAKRALPQKGDILLSKNGTIGLTKVVNWNHEVSIFVSLCLIRPTNQLNPNYFAFFFNSPVVDEQLSFGSKRTSVTNLHLDKIKELILLLPPTLEQSEIVVSMDKRLHPFYEAIKLVGKEIETLNELKQTLIANAVTGKIKV